VDGPALPTVSARANRGAESWPGNPTHSAGGAIERLQARLQEAASEKTKDWWERYLKGAASFRGVPMPVIRSTLRSWYTEEGLDDGPASDRKQLALDLLAENYSEDKLAGVLLLREHILADLTVYDIPSFAGAFHAGHIADWSVCDWFSVKVLSALIERDGRPMAEALAAWTRSDPLWQRGAAAVGLAPLAPRGDQNFEGFVELSIDVARANVRDDERFMQTSVGWLLRELSKTDPSAVQEFVREHERLLSREAHRMALAKIEGRGRR
jgi:3-methyladenine DNA glycosylase AlkD